MSPGLCLYYAIFRLTVERVLLQTAAIVPYGITYLLPSRAWRGTGSDRLQRVWPTTWPAEFQNGDIPTRCISYSPRAHPDAIQLAVDAGCSGARADIWLHDGEILVGQSIRDLDEGYTLNGGYLNPLMRRTAEWTSDRGMDMLEETSREGFILFLDVKTSLRALWPRLVAQLEPLRDAGYLTNVNGSLVVPRFLTVVLTGAASRESIELSDGSYNDIFFDTSLDELVLEDAESLSGLSVDTQPQSQASAHQNIPPPPHFYSATTNFKESIGFPLKKAIS